MLFLASAACFLASFFFSALFDSCCPDGGAVEEQEDDEGDVVGRDIKTKRTDGSYMMVLRAFSKGGSSPLVHRRPLQQARPTSVQAFSSAIFSWFTETLEYPDGDT